MTTQNNYLFSFLFVFISFLSFYLPDIDQGFLFFLGHRSAITHSFLIPFLIYYFYLEKKEKPNKIIQIVTLSLFFGFSAHFCADLIVKGWRGFSLITFLGIRFPAFVSILWIFANAIICMIFANKILIKLSNLKSTFSIFYILGAIITFVYFLTDYVSKPIPQFTIFILIHSIIFFYFIKKNNKKIIKNKKQEDKNAEIIKKRSKIKKKSSNFLLETFVCIFIICIGLVIGLENSNKSKNIKKNIVKESFRSKSVFDDEFELCQSKITSIFPKTKFTQFAFSNFSAPKNKISYDKIIYMWMKHKRFFIELSFGNIDCKIRVNKDQSIKFLSLGKKYKNK